MLAIEAELDLDIAEDAHCRATGAVLADAPTAALLRGLADDFDPGTRD
ncbi:hypothetical protein [Streptomyces sp. CFMR 7]